jgi:hypothetical protein
MLTTTIERPDVAQGAIALSPEGAILIARQRFPQLSGDGIRLSAGAAPQPIHADQVQTAMAFLRLLRPTKHSTIDSGTLKHDVENWGSVTGMSSYVSRGATIAAAIGLGLSVCPFRYGGDVQIGVNSKDLKGLNAETLTRRLERRGRITGVLVSKNSRTILS